MNRLRHVLSQEDAVIFVGSGLSAWSGIPSWPGFVEELAQYLEQNDVDAGLVRQEAQRGDLLQAASYGFFKLTKPQIGEFVRSACRFGTAKPHEIHKALVSLGPNCFVTTNYDNLIEMSLRKWQQSIAFRPAVTNRHLTELADIVHARANNFIFKPHGDAGDTESIILTREQYRQLLPGGERHSALETLKMILATRPVVYVGFGLRDPDFMYVRDLLSNTFKGGTRDHYAITADVAAAEVDYWRNSYGIHLISYNTTARSDGSRDHTELFALLKSLGTGLRSSPVAATSEATSLSSQEILALARHAARLARTPKHHPEFPIHVRAHRPPHKRHDFSALDAFDYCSVEKFLDHGPFRSILIGPPGAGKTYAIYQSAARLSDKLAQSCFAEEFDKEDVLIPIVADLKLYDGDLHGLVNRTLPIGLTLKALAERCKVKVYLDSFNEMPRGYWETGTYEADFTRFIAGFPTISIVIGSRTNDGLSKVDFPIYELDEIDKEFVARDLERQNIAIKGRFQREVCSLLQKPFYFQLVASGAVRIPDEPNPRDFYRAYFLNLRDLFQKRFDRYFDIEVALSRVAFEAIDRGAEAQPLTEVLRILEQQVESAGLTNIQAIDIVNWLVSSSVFIPYTGARIAFFHQSVTEYLAALDLARRFCIDAGILQEKMRFLRWDHALFLALSVLSAKDGAAFYRAIIKTDFLLALKAAKYVEFGRDEIVKRLLEEIPSQLKNFDDFLIAGEIEFNLAISLAHEAQLRTLMKKRDSVGGAAAIRLAELRGASVKTELLQTILEAKDDYNYCVNGVARALQSYAVPTDAKIIAVMADTIVRARKSEDTRENENDEIGFRAGAAAFLSKLELPIIQSEFIPLDGNASISELKGDILCDILREHKSPAALSIAADILLRGVGRAATVVYFIWRFSKKSDQLPWAEFSLKHVDHLISKLDSTDADEWNLKALNCICMARPDLAESVRIRATGAKGLRKAALLHCVCNEEQSPIFAALEDFAILAVQEGQIKDVCLLNQMELNWAGQEDLFLRLLRLQNRDLALALLNSETTHPTIRSLDIGPIEWWLDWLQKEFSAKSDYWLCARISEMFARVLDKKRREAFLSEFNRQPSGYRRLLAYRILPHFSELTTDDFSESAIAFLLTDLKKTRISSFRGHLVGQTATESFVIDRLLPLVPDAKPTLATNLASVLRQAGSRHNRRYTSS